MIYRVGICPVCKEGALGVRICGQCSAPAIICDECDALWQSPEQITSGEPANYAEQPELPCPQCSASLAEEPSHWADQKEIRAAGWSESIENFADEDE